MLIGQAGLTNVDRVDTPYSAQQPGVMLHATVLDNLLAFGVGGYPVNRDRIVASVGSFEMRGSLFYGLICVLLPVGFQFIGLILRKSASTRSLGTLLADHSIICAGPVAACIIPALVDLISSLDALAVFISAYLLLAPLTFLDWLVTSRMEHAYA